MIIDRMTEEKVQEAFRSAGESEPLFRAIKQLINDYFDDECKASIAPGLSSEDRAYNSGRAQAISDVRYYIMQCRGLTQNDASSNKESIS